MALSLQITPRWVNRFMHHAQILEPLDLAVQHRENALKLAKHYE
jgi:hypothetical protein